MVAAKPLKKISVVEGVSPDCGLAEQLAVAFAGRIAADLGAAVRCDGTATIGAQDMAAGAFLGDDKQRFEDFERLDRLADADAVLCDDAYHAAFAANAPAAIWVIVSSRGAAPDRSPASEFTLSAETGLLDMVGEPDLAPLRLGGHQLSYASGLAAYSGLAAALCRRTTPPVGEIVRISLADVGVWINWKSVAMAAWSDRRVARQGQDAEWRIVRCADGWIALVFRDADWPALREIVGDARLMDPRYDDRIERRRDAALIAAIVEEAFAQRNRADLRAVSLARRVPLGAVWSPLELCNDPQYDARNFLVPLEHSVAGTMRPRLPVMWRQDGESAA